MKMNIYAHAVSAARRSDGAVFITTVVNLAASMEDSIALAYKGILANWPRSLYHKHQVLTDESQQITQSMIDAVTTKPENLGDDK
jgi:hypothetical protein